jgi:hypothetical protein
VREAAAVCVRNMARSVRTLRMQLVNTELVSNLMPLIEDPSKEVVLAATAAICNLCMGHSPVQGLLLEHRVVDKLVSAMDMEGVAANGLCAFKNMMYAAQGEALVGISALRALHDSIMEKLSWARLKSYLESAEVEVQVNAVGVLRNLLHSSSAAVDKVIEAFDGPRQLLDCVDRLLVASAPSVVVENALFCLANVCTSADEAHRNLVASNERLLLDVLDCVVRGVGGGGGAKVRWWWWQFQTYISLPQTRVSCSVQVAALWVLLNLVCHSYQGAGWGQETLVDKVFSSFLKTGNCRRRDSRCWTPPRF